MFLNDELYAIAKKIKELSYYKWASLFTYSMNPEDGLIRISFLRLIKKLCVNFIFGRGNCFHGRPPHDFY